MSKPLSYGDRDNFPLFCLFGIKEDLPERRHRFRTNCTSISNLIKRTSTHVVFTFISILMDVEFEELTGV